MNNSPSLAPRTLLLFAFLLGAPACGGDAAPPAKVATGFPCEVEAIIKAKCQTCHTEPPRMGAPIHILSYADTQVAPPDDPKKKVWEYMELYITMGFMPLKGSPTGPLTDPEKATMLGWLKGGPVASTTICP